MHALVKLVARILPTQTVVTVHLRTGLLAHAHGQAKLHKQVRFHILLLVNQLQSYDCYIERFPTVEVRYQMQGGLDLIPHRVTPST